MCAVNAPDHISAGGLGALLMPELPASVAAIRAAAVQTLRDAAADERLSARLAVVGATVTIELRGHPDATFAVRMEHDAIAVVDDAGDARADIRLDMDPIDLHELFAGGLHLPMKIARGQVTYTGQVRRFLRVVPILAHMGPGYASHLAAAQGLEDGL